ncbi:hypothetical protein ACP70R_010435 [Stipagrostis hirtigluma subsp. patula]
MDLIVSSMKREINKYASPEEVIHKGTCTIHKIPQHIREVDQCSYEPIVLSIGPYHQGAQALLSMEKEKWKSLDFILKTNCNKTLHDYLKVTAKLEKQARKCYSEEIKMERKQFVKMLLLDVCFALVKIDGSVSTALRDLNHYGPNGTNGGNSDTITEKTGSSRRQVNNGISIRSMSSKSMHQYENLVPEMEFFNDNVSCTTLGRSSTNNGKELQSPSDSNVLGDWYSVSAWHDLFLLENQIPFFVIDRIYRFVMDGIMMDASPAEKFSESVEDILRQFPIAIKETDRPKQYHHFLHLCHMYLRPSQKTAEIYENPIKPGYLYRLLHFGHNYAGISHKSEGSNQSILPIQQRDCFQTDQLPSRWRQATQYHEAGIGLVKREYSKYEKHSLLDIKFSYGVVEIPCFPVDENTESLFKNLIAFEQADPRVGNDITAYAVFLSQFVSTLEDAMLLTEKGIIIHMLDSDDEVPALFTRISKQVVFGSDDYYYLKSLCWVLEAHYQSRLNRWLAWLWRNHFSNPWLALAVLAAVVVLLCTVIQTIFTVLAYIKPPES